MAAGPRSSGGCWSMSGLDDNQSAMATDRHKKKIIIIAGPNGAGKTTFATEFLPNEANCPEFINADLIAAGISPFDPDKAAFRAGRLMLEEMRSHIDSGTSFAFETTLSGRSYLQMIPQWRTDGYHVSLFFLRLQSVELAISRVRQRVLAGGHDIPEHTIRRRFTAGFNNFDRLYKPAVNEWALYDNSGISPYLIEAGSNP